VDKLKDLQNNFTEFLDTLVDPTIFNTNWKMLIKHKMNLFWERLETAPIIPIGYEVIEVDYHLDPEKEKELTYTMVDEMTLVHKKDDESNAPILSEKVKENLKSEVSIKKEVKIKIDTYEQYLGSKAIEKADFKKNEALWYKGMTSEEIEKEQAYEVLEQIQNQEMNVMERENNLLEGFEFIKSNINVGRDQNFRIMKNYYSLLDKHSLDFEQENQFFILKFDNYSVGLNPYDLLDLLENYYIEGENTFEDAYYQMLYNKESEYER
jgi:hypothetical protein